MKNHELYRKVTHTEYKGLKKIGDKGPQSWLRKEIGELDEIEYRRSFGNKEDIINAEFLLIPPHAHIWPRGLGGIALFLLVINSYFSCKEGDLGSGFEIFLYFFCWVILGLCIIYYFTMPKKEIIFDRMHGTITFPGWLWSKNITMPFDAIKFSYTTGGANMIGAYELQLIRPDKLSTTYYFAMGGNDCYQDMSVITWYMDKNRPLPPHKDFDPYREKDFLRRKKAAFQKPLYPSRIPTPEATPEQQAEREKAWKG
jgi:hypothetical protein